MKYIFNIVEIATYGQTGTVDVEADSLEEARAKCLAGDYEHHGDCEVLLDTESDTKVINIIQIN